MIKLKEMVREMVREVINERRLDSKVKKAILIAIEMSGDMTGAADKIEKIKKGLSRHKKVKDALRLANESISEGSAYKTATNNELAMYLTQLSNTINGTKDRKMLNLLKRTKKEVDDELKSRKSINEAGMFDDYHELNPAYMDKFIKSYKKLNSKNVVKKKGDYTYGFRKGEREAHWKFDNDDYKLQYDIAKVKALGLINNFNRFKKDHPWG